MNQPNPTLSIIIAAYNEENWIESKIQNTLELMYPKNKMEIILVADGSTDSTVQKAKTIESEQLRVIYEPERRGKMAAVDRAVSFASGEILIFTDANTLINKDALIHISEAFLNPEIGMVAGEKRVLKQDLAEKGTENEGLYWKYESWLKQLDSDTSSVIGAAGELFAIRKNLFETLPSDTLLDDFMLSVLVLKAGFKIKYVPQAYAVETSSLSVSEEWKRKVRIGAGGIQSTIRSFELANPFKYGIISYSYLIHRIARWTIAPLATLIAIISGSFLILENWIYWPISLSTILLTIITLIGIKNGLFQLPGVFRIVSYFLMMNFSVIAGWFRFLSGKQTVLWEKAKR